MDSLTEEEEELAREVLNSVDDEVVNIFALDLRYGEEWYEEQIERVDEMIAYFEDVIEVTRMADRQEIMENARERRGDLIEVRAVYTKTLEEMRSRE
jgi:hypothetical protein